MSDGCYSAIAGMVFKYSAQELLDLCCNFTLNSIAEIQFLGLLRHARYMHRASRRKLIYMDNAIPCSADCGAEIPSVMTDRRSIAPAQRHQNHRCTH